MNTKKQLIILTLLSVVFLGCSAKEPILQENQEIALTVLHTNSHHGHFWKNDKGEFGLAAQKTLVDRIRAEVESKGGQVLLLSGGDINTGSFESDMQKAEPDFVGMSAIGYDAMVVGSHEFDNSLEILEKQQSWVNFPFLSANIYHAHTRKRIFEPYKIFNKNGLKIAVIALTTQDSQELAHYAQTGPIFFADPMQEFENILPEVKKHNPHLIFALTHIGHYENGNHKHRSPGDVTLAQKTKKGVLSLIVGGRSQVALCVDKNGKYDKNFAPSKACKPDFQNGTYIVQAEKWGRYLGRADFTYKNGEFKLKNYELIPINLVKEKIVKNKKTYVRIGEEIPEDKDMIKLLKPYKDKFNIIATLKIGKTDAKLQGDRAIVRQQQTSMGKLITASMMYGVKADFSLINSGAVRSSIEAGDILYKHVLNVQPFENYVVKAMFKGDELLKYLDEVARKPKKTGGYVQFSSNLSMVVTKNGVQNVKLNGKKIDKNKTYSIALTDFIAMGGDGYPRVKNFTHTQYVDNYLLKEFIEKNSPISVKQFEPKNEIQYR